MSERVKTYPWDLVLFKELGLQPFDIKSGYKHHVGKVDFENDSWVRIWVVGKPAQFWEFEIYDKEAKTRYKVNTGSGTFGDFWPCVSRMARNLFTVRCRA